MIRLAVRVSIEQSEMVLAELLELAPAGVEEVSVGADVVEYAVYGAPGELPSLPDLHAVAGEALVEISHERAGRRLAGALEAVSPPLLLEPPRAREGEHAVPALHVRPPWEAPSSHGDGPVREIVIDPGQAFGTGAHASTRMCLELLMELAVCESPRGALLDVGTGSGVLAIAAAGLGFDPVLGLDHERESVQAAGENAAVNGVEIEVRRFELRTQALPWLEGPDTPAAPIVVLANLLRPLLLELASTMTVAPAHLIASGLLREEVDEIAGAFGERLGLRERERRASGEWAAVWLQAA